MVTSLKVKKMKLLYCVRLFSGLTSSIIKESWNPQGAPTIYRFIEAVDKNNDIDSLFLFTPKGEIGIDIRSKKVIEKKIKGFYSKTFILPWLSYKTKFLRIISEFYQVLLIVKYTIKFKPDILYFDNSNIVSAALMQFFSNFFAYKIVVRIMGVYPAMHKLHLKKSIKNLLYLSFYKRKYDLVICTQDGSSVESWVKKTLHKKTQVKLMLNGVDLIFERLKNKKILSVKKKIKKLDLKILFVGRLEPHKGCDNFIKAALMALKLNINLKFVIIGYGSQEAKLKNIVKKSCFASNFIFLSNVNHKEILYFYQLCDIYVSLNAYGNFSNTNLEAMRVGTCMILPNTLPGIGFDKTLKNLLPEDTYISLHSVNSIEALSEYFINLYRNKDKINDIKLNMQKISKKFIPSWDSRIRTELEFLTELVKYNE